MPKRKLTKTAMSNAVMGDDSYVTYREPSTEVMADFRKQDAEYKRRIKEIQNTPDIEDEDVRQSMLETLVDEYETFNAKFMAEHILEWNWVADEDGNVPLEQPHENPDVFMSLLGSEVKWLGQLFNVSIEKKHVSKKRL